MCQMGGKLTRLLQTNATLSVACSSRFEERLMSFGRRTARLDPPSSRAKSSSQFPPRVAPTRAQPRRGGYFAGLVAAVLGFVASAVLAVLWAISVDSSTKMTPVSLLQFVLVNAGPVIVPIYALCLAVTDLVLKALRVRGPRAYVLLDLAFVGALMVVPLILLNPAQQAHVFLVLFLPGAAIGGAVLGHFRRD